MTSYNLSDFKDFYVGWITYFGKYAVNVVI